MARAMASPPPSRRRRVPARDRGGGKARGNKPSKTGASSVRPDGKLRRPGARKKVPMGGGDHLVVLANKKKLGALRGSTDDDPFGLLDKKKGSAQFALRTPRRPRPNKKNKNKNKKLQTGTNKNKTSSGQSDGGAMTHEPACTRAGEAPPRLQLGLRNGDSLDDELRRFAAFVALSPREKQVRARVFRELRAVIRAGFADATVALYGSSSSGLDTFRSDLDVSVGNISLASLERASATGFLASTVAIDADDSDASASDSEEPQDDGQGGDGDEESSFSLNLSLPSSFSLNVAMPTASTPPATSSLLFQSQRMAGIHLPAPIGPTSTNRAKATWNPTRRRQKLRELRALQLLLKTQRPHLRVKCLPKAKVPILMVEDPESCVEIDVGINREVFASSEHGRSTSLAVKLQGALGRPFMELVAFLKEFLHQFELDKPFTGGLGSFRLYVMVASVFPSQSQPKPGSRLRREPSAATQRASDLLLRFLELFGNRKRAKYLHANTRLSLAMDPSCVIDFTGVFRLDECIEMFAMAFDILSSSRTLASIIYEDRLARDREIKWRQAVDSDKENAGDNDNPAVEGM